MSKGKYRLTLTGLTYDEAKDAAEQGSSLRWLFDGRDYVAHPGCDKTAIISKDDKNKTRKNK